MTGTIVAIDPGTVNADPAELGRQPAAAAGAVPARADGRPVRPGPQGVLRPPRRRRGAEDAGGGRVPAEAA